LQDSYSRAHTLRNAEGIVDFYYYEDKDHDRKKHSQLDLVRDQFTHAFTPDAQQAISASEKLLRAAYADYGDRREALIKVLNDQFKLGENFNKTGRVVKGELPKKIRLMTLVGFNLLPKNNTHKYRNAKIAFDTGKSFPVWNLINGDSQITPSSVFQINGSQSFSAFSRLDRISEIKSPSLPTKCCPAPDKDL
jgi:hypothetical protein